MKSKVMFGVIVLIGTMFLQGCKEEELVYEEVFECALRSIGNGWAPENECVEEGKKPSKAALVIFEEAEQAHINAMMQMYEEEEEERRLAEEQRRRQEAARNAEPDFALEWFEDYSQGILVEGWRIVALEDQVTVTGVIVNRGNCKATLGADVPLWFMTEAKYPVTLTYGNQARFRVPSNCNVREITVSTSRGSWVTTFTR